MSVLIGIDLGHSSVKVAGVRTGKKPVFIGCKEVAMEPRYLRKQGFEDYKVVAKALKEALKTAAPKAIKGNRAVAVISEPLLFRKVLPRPKGVSDSELLAALQLQAADFVPEGVDVGTLDYQPLTELTEEGEQQLMVIGAPHQIVNDYVQVCKHAGLRLGGIEPKGCSLARVHAPFDDGAHLLVDIGSEMSSVQVCRGGVPWLVSTINVGGNIIRETETLAIIEDEARRTASLERLAEVILTECEQVVSYYVRQFIVGRDIPSTITVTGGASLITGFLELLGKEAEGRFKVVPALCPLVDTPPFCDRRFMAAVGAALSEYLAL